jgi:hypothetical protein
MSIQTSIYTLPAYSSFYFSRNLAVDSNENIFFFKSPAESSTQIKMYKSTDNGVSFSNSNVNLDYTGGYFVVTGVDNSGNTWIGHTDNYLGYVYAKKYDGASWSSDEIAYHCTLGGSLDIVLNDMCIDSEGYPYILINLLRNQSGTLYTYLILAYKDGTGWHEETLFSETGSNGILRMFGRCEFDSNDNLMILFVDKTSPTATQLKFIQRDNLGNIDSAVSVFSGMYASGDLAWFNLVVKDDVFYFVGYDAVEMDGYCYSKAFDDENWDSELILDYSEEEKYLTSIGIVSGILTYYAQTYTTGATGTFTLYVKQEGDWNEEMHWS